MHITPIWSAPAEHYPWMARRLCDHTTAHLFFAPESEASAEIIAKAKAICERCPVKAECLAYADALGKKAGEGVWGGLTAHERELRVRRTKRHEKEGL